MKKTISILLSLSMLVGLMTIPTAAASQGEMATAMQALGIMIGDENGDMNLDSQVTRAEYATLAVRATPNSSVPTTVATNPFPDVPKTLWSAPYVSAATKYGYILGHSDSTFKPEDQITLSQGLAVTLRMLGYTSANLNGGYPDSYMEKGDELGLRDDLTISDPNAILTREDAMIIFYNALTATTAMGTTYMNTLGYPLTAGGEVDITALVNGAMEGPVIATGDWTSKVKVDLITATILKDGKNITAGQIGEYDVLYWSDNMRTVWVYSDRVTGTIQMITPSTTAPSAVMVAGQTYPLATNSAIYALSQQGGYKVGNSVTLLLDRNGSVAEVTSPASTAVDRVGMVTAIQKSSYDGGAYTADSITILATDGKYYSYPASTTYFGKGDLVRITTLANGTISVSRAYDDGLFGVVSADGTTLGKLTLASNVQILEIYKENTQGAVVYPSRLAGVNLAKSDILYSELNDQGEVSRLILKDVTGDLHSYAIVTEVVVAEFPGVVNFTSYYHITMGEVETVLQIAGARYTTKEGPAFIQGGLSNVKNITTMDSVEATHISGNVVYDGARGYTMADGMQVYEKDGSDYYVTTLERAQTAGLTLTAYYDQPMDEGGRVRMIIAE